MNAGPAIRPRKARRRCLPAFGIGLLVLGAAAQARAGEVEIVAVDTAVEGDGRFGFDVTLRHADSGWEHYADRWEVRLVDGTVLGRRVLLHPHVNEQPFTRSLGGVAIPVDVDRVFVHAHDKLDGWSRQAYEVTLPAR